MPRKKKGDDRREPFSVIILFPENFVRDEDPEPRDDEAEEDEDVAAQGRPAWIR